MDNRKLIAGVGSALVDILSYENEDFLARFSAARGGMILVDSDRIEKILSCLSGEPAMVPGGSACNTIVGIARLGGAARFAGQRGDDQPGVLLETILKQSGVDPVLSVSSTPTGKVISIITSDAQRSMFTFLGASAETTPNDITAGCFDGAAIVHIEGYLLFNRELILAAARVAKNAGALVSLDLASYTVVEDSREFLEGFTRKYVDILIANEDEARVFTGQTNETKALKALSEYADTAALKVGSRGSYISHAGHIVRVEPCGDGKVLDTTGAGDLWASGFLYGLVNGYSLEKCGEIASTCGWEVCRVVGAVIPDEGWQRIKRILP